MMKGAARPAIWLQAGGCKKNFNQLINDEIILSKTSYFAAAQSFATHRSIRGARDDVYESIHSRHRYPLWDKTPTPKLRPMANG